MKRGPARGIVDLYNVGLWTVDCGLWIVGCGPWTVNCGIDVQYGVGSFCKDKAKKAGGAGPRLNRTICYLNIFDKVAEEARAVLFRFPYCEAPSHETGTSLASVTA